MDAAENRQDLSTAFGRADTKAIKGIAIVLMMFHHLAAFSNRLPAGFGGFESIWEGFVTSGHLQAFANAAKICVSIFFFLGGYGLYIRWKSARLSVTKNIFDLYKTYWKVFIVFIPIAILFFAREGEDINALCTLYVFDGKTEMLSTVLSNFIGWTCSLNREWWFFKSYVCAIPLGYLFCKATKKHQNFWLDLFIVFGLDILIRTVFPALPNIPVFSALNQNVYYASFFKINNYASVFFAGIVFAKYDGICKMKEMLRQLPCCTLLSLVGFGILWLSSAYVLGSSADIVYCALMIPMLSVMIDKFHLLKKGFAFLGKHSTNMWLIHTFYCYYFLEVTHLVYATNSVLLDLLILLALSLVSSIVLNGFYTMIGKIGNGVMSLGKWKEEAKKH